MLKERKKIEKKSLIASISVLLSVIFIPLMIFAALNVRKLHKEK